MTQESDDQPTGNDQQDSSQEGHSGISRRTVFGAAALAAGGAAVGASAASGRLGAPPGLAALKPFVGTFQGSMTAKDASGALMETATQETHYFEGKSLIAKKATRVGEEAGGLRVEPAAGRGGDLLAHHHVPVIGAFEDALGSDMTGVVSEDMDDLQRAIGERGGRVVAEFAPAIVSMQLGSGGHVDHLAVGSAQLQVAVPVPFVEQLDRT